MTLPVVDTVVVGEPPADAANDPPADIKFSLTTDLSLMTTTTSLAVAATVCLPTTDVPSDREPILFHYFTAADQAADTWNEIGRDTATRAGASFVCGETTTFSPFAVGYTVIKNQTDFGFANPTVSKILGEDDATFTATASGGSGTGAVTYASGDTAIATVTNSGEVTILAVGSTTITAIKAGDTTYNAATASYVLTVFMTQEIDLPDAASGATVSGYVTLPVVDTVVVGEPPADAANDPPAGIKFSLTTDLSLMTTTTSLAVAATVCLPTTDVPSDREPILFHYFTAADQAADTWNEIGRDTATRDGVRLRLRRNHHLLAVRGRLYSNQRQSAGLRLCQPDSEQNGRRRPLYRDRQWRFRHWGGHLRIRQHRGRQCDAQHRGSDHRGGREYHHHRDQSGQR